LGLLRAFHALGQWGAAMVTVSGSYPRRPGSGSNPDHLTYPGHDRSLRDDTKCCPIGGARACPTMTEYLSAGRQGRERSLLWLVFGYKFVVTDVESAVDRPPSPGPRRCHCRAAQQQEGQLVVVAHQPEDWMDRRHPHPRPDPGHHNDMPAPSIGWSCTQFLSDILPAAEDGAWRPGRRLDGATKQGG